MDVQALNMRTGVFERDMSYLSRCVIPSGDVDVFATEMDFDAYVRKIRDRIAAHTSREP